PCVLTIGSWWIAKRCHTASKASEMEAPPLSERMVWGAPERRHAVSRTISATQLASVGATAPARIVREEPSRMIRLHHLTPARAKAMFRPSMNQYSWGAVALEGCGPGAFLLSGLPTCGLSSSTCLVSAI